MDSLFYENFVVIHLSDSIILAILWKSILEVDHNGSWIDLQMPFWDTYSVKYETNT
jgi:hypothetical protein